MFLSSALYCFIGGYCSLFAAVHGFIDTLLLIHSWCDIAQNRVGTVIGRRWWWWWDKELGWLLVGEWGRTAAQHQRWAVRTNAARECCAGGRSRSAGRRTARRPHTRSVRVTRTMSTVTWQLHTVYRAAATNLEYSGISLNMKNSENSMQPLGKIVSNKVVLVSHWNTHTHTHARTHTRTHTFNGPFSGTTWVVPEK